MGFGGARIHAVAGANGGRDASWSGGTRASSGPPLVASGFGRLGLAGGGVVLLGEFSLFHPAALVDGALLVVGVVGRAWVRVSGVFSRLRRSRHQLLTGEETRECSKTTELDCSTCASRASWSGTSNPHVRPLCLRGCGPLEATVPGPVRVYLYLYDGRPLEVARQT